MAFAAAPQQVGGAFITCMQFSWGWGSWVTGVAVPAPLPGYLALSHFPLAIDPGSREARRLSSPVVFCFGGGKFESPAYWISFQHTDKAEETSVA